VTPKRLGGRDWDAEAGGEARRSGARVVGGGRVASAPSIVEQQRAVAQRADEMWPRSERAALFLRLDEQSIGRVEIAGELRGNARVAGHRTE
jgi:hypothetical protein